MFVVVVILNVFWRSISFTYNQIGDRTEGPSHGLGNNSFLQLRKRTKYLIVARNGYYKKNCPSVFRGKLIG